MVNISSASFELCSQLIIVVLYVPVRAHFLIVYIDTTKMASKRRLLPSVGLCPNMAKLCIRCITFTVKQNSFFISPYDVVPL